MKRLLAALWFAGGLGLAAPAFADVEPPCLGGDVMDQVRTSVSIDPAWESCGAEGTRVLLGEGFPELTAEDLKAVLATIVAPRIAPYGSSQAVVLEDIMKAEALACANFVAFMAQAVGDSRMDFVGFEGGAVGNHAQILYRRDDLALLLDPTIGLVARIDFDPLLMGESLQSGHVVRYYPEDGGVQSFADKVMKAVSEGLYRPSDLLYYYEDYMHMRSPTNRPAGQFITPGGMTYRTRPQFSSPSPD